MAEENKDILRKFLLKQTIEISDRCQIGKLMTKNLAFYELVIFLNKEKLDDIDIVKFVQGLAHIQITAIKIKNVFFYKIDQYNNVYIYAKAMSELMKLDNSLSLFPFLQQFQDKMLNQWIKGISFNRKQLFTIWELSNDELKMKETDAIWVIITNEHEGIEEIYHEDTKTDIIGALRTNLAQTHCEILALWKNNWMIDFSSFFLNDFLPPFNSLKHLVLKFQSLEDLDVIFSLFTEENVKTRTWNFPNLETMTINKEQMFSVIEKGHAWIALDVPFGDNPPKSYSLVLTYITEDGYAQYEIWLSGRCVIYHIILSKVVGEITLIDVNHLCFSSSINYIKKVPLVTSEIPDEIISDDRLATHDQKGSIMSVWIEDFSKVWEITYFSFYPTNFRYLTDYLDTWIIMEEFVLKVKQERKKKKLGVDISVSIVNYLSPTAAYKYANRIISADDMNVRFKYTKQRIEYLKTNGLDLKTLEFTYHIEKSYAKPLLKVIKSMASLQSLHLVFVDLVDAIECVVKMGSRNFDKFWPNLADIIIEFSRGDDILKKSAVLERYKSFWKTLISRRPKIMCFEFVKIDGNGEAITFPSDFQNLRKHVRIIFN
jgi:hypothetical protein